MGTRVMVNAMLEKLIEGGESYDTSLSPRDMGALLVALSTAVGFVGWNDFDPEYQDRAEDLFSSIAETLGVEGF
ncbi:hypothetical protein [Longimycelium tulufanense]|nr:hypothetical protein [Longimycelium tulufanense]